MQCTVYCVLCAAQFVKCASADLQMELQLDAKVSQYVWWQRACLVAIGLSLHVTEHVPVCCCECRAQDFSGRGKVGAATGSLFCVPVG